MSKYGFNENEVVKTITTMIDKDGFHKEVITYGKFEPSEKAHIATGLVGLTAPNPLAAEYFDVQLLTINVPEDANIIVKGDTTDEDLEFNIGDTIEDTSAFIISDFKISGVNAILTVDESREANTTVYYQIYAVNDVYEVLDRTKLTVEVHETAST